MLINMQPNKLTRLHHVALSRIDQAGAMELADLLAKAGSLPESQQRKVAAILGSLVADAAGTVSTILPKSI